jgi:starvation-inducible DNA-binding protein
MNATQKVFSQVFANVYALMLKTQNYHWHVKGPNFKPLHLMFEEQYNALFLDVDTIAERMITLGFSVPAYLSALNEFKMIKDGDHNLSAQEMVMDLAKDYVIVIDNIGELLHKAEENEDEGSLSLFSDLLLEFEKTLWMLKATSGGF